MKGDLKKDQNPALFYDIGDLAAIHKTAEALRGGASKFRKSAMLQDGAGGFLGLKRCETERRGFGKIVNLEDERDWILNMFNTGSDSII